MKYFLHDTNSFSDEKITELFLKFGYEGLGLFYTILEKIAFQEKPIKTQVLKSQLRVGKKLEKCWLFMEEIELIYSNNGETFNEKLLTFSEKYQIKKEKNKERVSQWRENQDKKKNVTRNKSVRNTSKSNKTNLIENIIIKSDEFISFENWVLEKAPSVSEMTNPFTQEEFEYMLSNYGKKTFLDMILVMENKPKLKTSYKSAKQTCENWIKNNLERQNNGNNKTNYDTANGSAKDRIGTDWKDF